MAVKVSFEITARVEGPLQETINCQPGEVPTLQQVLSSLSNLCFIAETIAHLQGKENLLPMTDLARKQIAALQPREA